MNHESSSYSDIKEIENLVDTFRHLVSKLSQEGNELGELYVRAERKAAHCALLSETVVESITSGILVVERGGKLGLMNSSARRLLGMPDRDETYHTRLSSLFSDARELASLVEEHKPEETFWLAWRTGEDGAALRWWRERLRRPELLSQWWQAMARG